MLHSPKADVEWIFDDRGLVPKAVIRPGLFDHLVGAQQKRFWDRQTKRLRSLEIHDQLKLGRQLYRQISGLRPLENQIDVCVEEAFRAIGAKMPGFLSHYEGNYS